MKQDLFALLAGAPDEITLAELARAITRPRRAEPIHVWRTFVRSTTTRPTSTERTQRMRVAIRAQTH